jgi:hypothetical protein
MDEAARCWGRSHDEILSSLCLHITRHVFGEDCLLLVRALFSSSPVSDAELALESGLSNPKHFSRALSTLTRHGVINSLTLNRFALFQHVLFPHFIEHAQAYARIPQDRSLISYILTKIFEEQTLSAEQLARSVLTKHPDRGLTAERLLEIIEHLCAENVIVGEDKGLSFNHQEFLGRARLRALESLVEFHDHRVVEVVRALFARDLFYVSLIDGENCRFETCDVVQRVAEMTGLSEREVEGVLEVLKSREFALVAKEEPVLTVQSALTAFKMRRIAGVLSEIGFPLARRVVNLLLRTEQLETSMITERTLLSSQECRTLLGKLNFLGVLAQEPLEDAPHTTLKKKYVMWKLNPLVAINNSCAYLLGVLTKLYYDLIEEQGHLSDLDSHQGGTSQENRKKTLDERIALLNNSIFSVTRAYLEIHEL